MELRRYLNIIRQRWTLIVITAIVAVAVSWMVTPRGSVYFARSTVYVGSQQFNTSDQSKDLSFDRLSALNSVLATYAVMVDSRPVAADALDRLGLQRSADAVVAATTAGAVPGTQILRIQVADKSPVVARDLVNAIASAFVDKVREVESPAAFSNQEGSLPTGIPVSVFERASLPTAPQPSGLLRNLVLAGMFGFLASAGLAFALEYLDVTIRNAADAERRLGMPVLGIIPMLRESAPLPAVVRNETAHVGRRFREADSA